MTVALYRGPVHVVVYADEGLIERAGRSLVGLPVSEAYTEPEYQPLIRLLDRTYRTGEKQALVTPYGVLTLLPRWEDGRVVGVASVFQPSGRPLPQRAERALPVSDLLRAG